jgi:hypothetical protein
MNNTALTSGEATYSQVISVDIRLKVASGEIDLGGKEKSKR